MKRTRPNAARPNWVPQDFGQAVQPKISKEKTIMKSITPILAIALLILSPVRFVQAQGT
jgi:hypothetical protein